MHGDIARNIFLRSGVATPTVMARKQVFDDIGLFEENIRYGEDDNMWIRIAAHYDVELIDEVLIKVRNHPQRMSLNKSELLESVIYNIHLLKTKYGENVKRRIEKAIPIKMSRAQFAVGYGHYERGNYREARKAFIKGAYIRIWYWKNPIYLILTFVPSGLTTILKLIKRKLASIQIQDAERKK